MHACGKQLVIKDKSSTDSENVVAGGIDRAQDMGTGVHGGGQGGENGGSTYSRGSPGSRTSSSGGGVKPADFDWGEILGEGSYSTVRKATRRRFDYVCARAVVHACACVCVCVCLYLCE